MKHQYTREILEPAVKDSVSVREVLKKLNLKFNGGTFSMVKFWIKKYGLDTSHFLGKRHNRGPRHKGGLEKLTAEKIFVVNRKNGFRENVIYLRLALDEVGVERKCRDCGNGEEWNGKPLTLQIEHINGNPLDNQRENLCYLCPNCHSQTKTWGSKKRA
jgi:Zn finger protein HypA/HybF involved in hydrogenase expression